MTTGNNLIIFAIVLFVFSFYFRLKRKKYTNKLLYLWLLFSIYLFSYYLRIYLVSHLGLYLNSALPFLIMSVVSGGEITPYSGPSSPNSSWTEDSFEMRVLLEPFSETEMGGNSSIPRVARDEAGPSHQPAILHNLSMESSLRNRVFRLEHEGSIFLNEQRWSERKLNLDQAPSQSEYNRLLDFENQDINIREKKHNCMLLLRQIVNENPHLLEEAPQQNRDLGDALSDFFQEISDELEGELGSLIAAEPHEIEMVNKVTNDMKKNGPDSPFSIRGEAHFGFF